MKSLRRPLCVLAGLLVGTAALNAQGQAWAGLQAGWADLANWSNPHSETRENEIGLGLHLSGEDGVVLVAFTGRVSTATPNRPPSEIGVQIGVGEFVNPNFLRRPSLKFVVDEKDSVKKTSIDASGTLALDSLAAGDDVKNGMARMRIADLQRMAVADTISGEVFGFRIVFRRDQIVALSDLTKRLNLDR